MTHKILSTLLVISWMFLIFMFSHQPATESATLSGGIINTLENLLNANLDFIHTPLRKGAHITVYFFLGAFLVNMYCHYTNTPKTIIILALITSILYAISDELHQTFIPGRSGEVLDVIYDTLGASFGIIIMYYLKQRIK